jgi:hypothetical protein
MQAANSSGTSAQIGSFATDSRAFPLVASFVAVLLLMAIASASFIDFIRASNVRQPLDSLEFDYLVGLIAAAIVAILLLCAPLAGAHRTALLLLWAAKSAITLGLMLAYEAQYDTLDAFSYHERAVGSSVQFDELAWGRSTELVTWIVQCLYVLTPASYHLAKVVFSFVGLVGIYLTWRALAAMTGKEKLQHLYLLGLFPSLLFWSSIVGKDPILVLWIGMYVLGVARLQQSRYSEGLLLAIVAAMLASLVRPWMGAILLLPMFAALAVQFSGARKPSAIVAVVVMTSFVLAAAVFGALDVDAASFVQSIDDVSKSWDEGGSAQTAPEFGSLSHVVAFVPLSAFTALFRPLPGEVGGPFGLAAGVENAVLLLASAFTITRFRPKHLLRPSFLTLSGVLVTWAIVYGFVSYQNLGTASRFKAQILPVLLPFLILLWQRVPRLTVHFSTPARSPS